MPLARHAITDIIAIRHQRYYYAYAISHIYMLPSI